MPGAWDVVERFFKSEPVPGQNDGRVRESETYLPVPYTLTLRAFSKIFTIMLPILYGPYFAYLAEDYSSGLIYIVPVLFSIILISLDNIQDHLENPFDLVGEDDVRFNVEKFIETLDN
jgi:predicted membrane chloride channel (bestrophin family)